MHALSLTGVFSNSSAFREAAGGQSGHSGPRLTKHSTASLLTDTREKPLPSHKKCIFTSQLNIILSNHRVTKRMAFQKESVVKRDNQLLGTGEGGAC